MNKRALDNLLVWSFVKSKMNFLPKAFRDAQLEFDKVWKCPVDIPNILLVVVFFFHKG
jgi:hypothetical protein